MAYGMFKFKENNRHDLKCCGNCKYCNDENGIWCFHPDAKEKFKGGRIKMKTDKHGSYQLNVKSEIRRLINKSLKDGKPETVKDLYAIQAILNIDIAYEICMKIVELRSKMITKGKKIR